VSKRHARQKDRTQAPYRVTDDWHPLLPIRESEVSLLEAQMLDILLMMVEQKEPKDV
jgi:hypothetical protein